MMWRRFILLFLLFLMGRHLGFPSSPRYLELADSADYFIGKENWPRAEEKIIEALRLEPANFSNSLLLANLGHVQSRQGEYTKAVETLTLGLNIAPSFTVLLNNRAHAFLLLDSISLAISDLDKSLKIDSVQQWTLQTRGFLYLRQQELERADQVFNTLNKKFPENTSVLAGKAEIAAKQGHIAEAKSLYNKALDLNPNDEETRETYIFLLIQNEEYTEARSLIKEGLSLNPENGMFYLLRGYLHRLNYRPDEALADKKTAVGKGIDPTVANQFIP